MKREIKFRGKRLDNGEWAYGDLLRTLDGFAILKSDECAPVDPATIDQFTGLYDRVGKEIYEGDILRVEGNKKTLTACFKDGGFEFPWNDGSDEIFPNYWIENSVYVIGNVFDNPELLKGGEK